MVVAGDRWSRGWEFEPRQRILDGSFFAFIVLLFEETISKLKWSRIAQFLNKNRQFSLTNFEWGCITFCLTSRFGFICFALATYVSNIFSCLVDSIIVKQEVSRLQRNGSSAASKSFNGSILLSRLYSDGHWQESVATPYFLLLLYCKIGTMCHIKF